MASLTKGKKVTLKKTAIYVSATATKKAATKSGTYYIWSAATKNGRIRIAKKKSYCGKNPAGKYVVGWIETKAISTASKDAAAANKALEIAAKIALENVKTQLRAEKLRGNPGNSSSGNTTKTDPLIPTSTTGMVGYLGTVRFIVRPGKIQTVSDFQWSSTAGIAEHERHMKRGKVEFTGMDAEDISFNMILSKYAGVSPMQQYNKLRKWQRNGTGLPLKIGTTSYGYYRWLIRTLKFNGERTGPDGEWATATVEVALKAYEK